MEVVVSPPTNKEILDLGVIAAVPETCLPVKFYGHVLTLANKVDYLLFLGLLVLRRVLIFALSSWVYRI